MILCKLFGHEFRFLYSHILGAPFKQCQRCGEEDFLDDNEIENCIKNNGAVINAQKFDFAFMVNFLFASLMIAGVLFAGVMAVNKVIQKEVKDSSVRIYKVNQEKIVRLKR